MIRQVLEAAISAPPSPAGLPNRSNAKPVPVTRLMPGVTGVRMDTSVRMEAIKPVPVDRLMPGVTGVSMDTMMATRHVRPSVRVAGDPDVGADAFTPRI